jgi:hypothetical protein
MGKKRIKLLQYSEELSHDVSKAEVLVNGGSTAFILMLYPHVIASKYGTQENKKAKSDTV